MAPKASKAAATKKTATKKTASKSADSKDVASKDVTKKAAAKKAPATKAPATKATAAKPPAKKAAAKKTAAKKAPAKKSATKQTSSKSAEAIQAESMAVGPDGKRVLADVPDEQFEADVKNDPTIKEDEKEASFIVSSADETDEPEQQVMVAGATADAVKDYLKQIGKVPLLNAEMEVELAKR
ncbi:MAG: histone H1-like repetitive region-containing protein, partial [Planctomycetes bacterium]|nr:histone H1-like repetitive region-containing protein [Planctomycetota bacterium]